MILKLFASRNHTIPPNPNPNFMALVVAEKPSILQIVHPGGRIERYYMAFPASLIIDKYPDFVLARPEIFRRPWDSVVRPEEMLVPGHKYFVVPIRTVRKLRRRIWRPSTEIANAAVVRFGKDSGVAEDNVKKKKKIVRFSPSLTMIEEARDFD